MTAKNKKTVAALLLAAVLLIVAPVIALRGAEFGGSDDKGSQMVEEVTGQAYEPWHTPILEQFLDGEIPGELESLLFCIQTAIGVGILAFFMGRFVERKKHDDER